MNKALTKIERSELEILEKRIEDHIIAFYLVGSSLASIKMKKLYRKKYGTFESYVAER